MWEFESDLLEVNDNLTEAEIKKIEEEHKNKIKEPCTNMNKPRLNVPIIPLKFKGPYPPGFKSKYYFPLIHFFNSFFFKKKIGPVFDNKSILTAIIVLINTISGSIKMEKNLSLDLGLLKNINYF